MNWQSLMDYKKEFINPMSGSLTSLFENQGIDVIMGKGTILDEHSIDVEGETVGAEYIVVATGQHSNKLGIEGKEYTNDSRDFLSMESLPNSITFIGAGIISIEFASIMIKLGVEVNVVHNNNEPLKGFNEAHIDKLIEKLKSEGVNFYFNENTQSVQPSGERFVVTTESVSYTHL